MEQLAGAVGHLVPLYVPTEHYPAAMAYVATLVGKPVATGMAIYQRDGVEWSEADIRDLAAAAKKWDFGVSYLVYIAERAPSTVGVNDLASDLKVNSLGIGGRLSGLGKWIKKRGKVRPDNPELTVWPIDLSYDQAGHALYRMSEPVAKIILEVLK